VQAFLKGCQQLLRAGDDGPNTLTGQLSLQKGHSIPTGDGTVVEHHTLDERRREDRKVSSHSELLILLFIDLWKYSTIFIKNGQYLRNKTRSPALKLKN